MFHLVTSQQTQVLGLSTTKARSYRIKGKASLNATSVLGATADFVLMRMGRTPSIANRVSPTDFGHHHYHVIIDLL
jgi:hypothetical protein